MTPAEIADEMRRLSRLLDKANTELRDRGRREAEAERDYRKGRAQAWSHVTGSTAQEKSDEVDALTADLRFGRDEARSDVRAANEAVRNLRQQISMCQTLSGLEKELAAFGRTGPELAA